MCVGFLDLLLVCLLACLLPGKGRKRSLEKGRKEKRRFKCSLVGPELKRAGKLGLYRCNKQRKRKVVSEWRDSIV
jgi:hypothetical protein